MKKNIYIYIYLNNMLLTLCANSYKSYVHYVRIARPSAIYTRLLIANSGNYLHLSIVVHYKTVRNNNLLSVNYNFNSNY